MVPRAEAAPAAADFLTTAEAQLGRLIMEHPEQRRANPAPHPILTQVARARAEDMAQRGYFDHVNPDGLGPNHFIREAGYPLAAIFSAEPAANNVESIAEFTSTPEATATLLLNSPNHRMHLLGLHEFYAAQNDYGVGHAVAPGNPARDVWVILSAFSEA
jgi:uncharacterized protein YkwD